MSKKEVRTAMKVSHIKVGPHDLTPPSSSSIIDTPKKWGAEFHIHNDEKYCAKAMVVFPGGKCSLHFHKMKTETFTLCSGKIIVETINLKSGESTKHLLCNTGDSITIYPGTPHTFYLPEDQLEPAWFVESSTQDFIDDSYRLTESTGPTSGDRGYHYR